MWPRDKQDGKQYKEFNKMHMYEKSLSNYISAQTVKHSLYTSPSKLGLVNSCERKTFLSDTDRSRSVCQTTLIKIQ